MKKPLIFITISIIFAGLFSGVYLFKQQKKSVVVENIESPSRQASEDKKDPHFVISGPGVSKSFSRSELLSLKGIRSITVEKDPAYDNNKMTYLAVPLAELFSDIAADSFTTMSFKCLDGFSGAISKTRALNQDVQGSVAYLAIEAADHSWPALKPGKPDTAGPFYLIWESPEKSKIMTEEWPYQLAGFELSNLSLDAQFPHTVPAENLSADDPINRGHHLFMTNCFVCHSFNGDGVGKIGPDLNIPFSPSEYFQFKHFSTLVRNPQNLRKWEQARMPGFSPSSLADEDLKSIWLYFGHMSKRKISQ